MRTKTMLVLAGGFLLGVVAMLSFGERYRILSAGAGKVVRVNRWTGDTWMQVPGQWLPISEVKTISEQEASELTGQLEKARSELRESGRQFTNYLNEERSLQQFLRESVERRQRRLRGLQVWCDQNPNGGLLDEQQLSADDVAALSSRSRERLAILDEVTEEWRSYTGAAPSLSER